MNLALKISPTLRAGGLDIEDMVEKSPLALEQSEGIESGRYKVYRISAIEILCEAIGCEPGELLICGN